MTNKEMIIDVLKDCGCQNSTQIKGAIYRKFGENISPQSISGNLRTLISIGYAAKSPDPTNNKMVYWLTDYGKEKLGK